MSVYVCVDAFWAGILRDVRRDTVGQSRRTSRLPPRQSRNQTRLRDLCRQGRLKPARCATDRQYSGKLRSIKYLGEKHRIRAARDFRREASARIDTAERRHVSRKRCSGMVTLRALVPVGRLSLYIRARAGVAAGNTTKFEEKNPAEWHPGARREHQLQ